MKWSKLLRKMYKACLAHDRASEMKLYFKALKKNSKSRLNNKNRTATQVTVRD
jgi:hypothetical protein